MIAPDDAAAPVTVGVTADIADDSIAAVEKRLAANLEAADQALEAATREPLTEGSTGQRRANPLYAVAERCDELALKFAEELRKMQKRREQPADPAGAGKGDPFASVDNVPPYLSQSPRGPRASDQ